jgi:hypothetical protein
MSTTCDTNRNPNAQRVKEGSIFDTYVIAGAAPPTSKVDLFNNEKNAAGAHICNLAQKGELGDGETFLVRAIFLEFINTTIADINQLQFASTLSLKIGGDYMFEDQPLSLFGAPGGAYGIEGANGGSSMGPLGWNTVKLLETPIQIMGKRAIRAELKITGAVSNSAAGGIKVRVHLWGVDGRA